MKFQQRIFSELSLDVAKGDEAAYAKIKELVQSELDCRKYFEMALRKEATIRKVALMLFGKDEEPTEEVLLRAVQALLEQPSKGDTRALVQRISAEEAGEKAKELFHQYKDADVCFITSDGQGFFTEHHARNHNHTIKGGDYFKFER